MKAKIIIMLKDDILDPQGRAISDALSALGFASVEGVRLGKYIEVDFDAPLGQADAQVTQMCEKLLANTVIESYRFEIKDGR